MGRGSSLRIGIDIGKALGVFDGIASYTRLLVAGLMRLDRENEYHLFDLRHPAIGEELFLGRFPDPPPNFHRRSGRRPEKGELDVFHSPAFMLPPGGAAGLVFTLHDLTFLTHPRFHTLANRVEALTSTAGAAARGARIVAVSEHTRRLAVELLGLPEGRLDVVHNAADPALRPAVSEEERERLASTLGVRSPYLLSVGSMEPRKNLGALLAAFADLPEEDRERCSLVVAGGPGWRNEALHEALGRLARQCTVHSLGVVSGEELRLLYSFAEAFVYPSISEGFGLPVVEAMACGAPVVTSNTSSLPEVAGDAALLVDPHNPADIAGAIGRILGDATLRDDLRRRGLERARTFSWTRAAREMLDIYRSAAGR